MKTYPHELLDFVTFLKAIVINEVLRGNITSRDLLQNYMVVIDDGIEQLKTSEIFRDCPELKVKLKILAEAKRRLK